MAQKHYSEGRKNTQKDLEEKGSLGRFFPASIKGNLVEKRPEKILLAKQENTKVLQNLYMNQVCATLSI